MKKKYNSSGMNIHYHLKIKKTGLIVFFLFFLFAGDVHFALNDSRNPTEKPKKNFQELVSYADLVYEKPVNRSEAGMPLGNGTMGTLIWTSPTAIKMQINRTDVFAVNKSTDSFKQRHTDYASGCGFVDIDMVDFGNDIFSNDHFLQKLHLYDGLMTLKGNGIRARLVALNNKDIFAIEIQDERNNPSPININLRMLRYIMKYYAGKNYELSEKHKVMIKTAGHTATSQLHIRDGNIVLTQEFSENDFYCSSALAIGIRGRESKARYLNESTLLLSAAPSKGSFTIYISSASSTKNVETAIKQTLNELNAVKGEDFNMIFAKNKLWWHDFWSKSYVDLNSKDGVADYVEKNYTYFQYVMASSSRGAYQPRYGGMLWYTAGDMREWGSQYWWNNQCCYYNALPPTNRMDLMQPMFSMYSRHMDSYSLAARQQWGSKGIWIPETIWFDGLKEMPEDIASEMRELYLLRKPWDQRSQKFRKYAHTKPKHNPRWNWGTVGRWEEGHWIIPEKGAGPFGHVTHIFSATAEIAYLAWLRYEYSQDKEWLRKYAYPLLKGSIEFYLNFPNLSKGKDGKYHIYHTNNNEGIWDAHNSLMDIAAIHGLTPILIRASEILDVDAYKRPVWKEFANNISPLPSTDNLDDFPSDKPAYWIGSIPPATVGNGKSPGLLIYYDLCNIGTENKDIINKGNASFDAIYNKGIGLNTPVHVLDKKPVAGALLGRSEAIKYLVPNQIRSDLTPQDDFCDWEGVGKVSVLPNRMTLREGPGALGCQRLGNAATALHKALLQSVPTKPGKDPIIYLFPAWPKEWNAEFSLLARGAFLVDCSIKKGSIGDITIRSKKGGICRIKNPWPDTALQLYRNGIKSEKLKGDLLTFKTNEGEILSLIKHMN